MRLQHSLLAVSAALFALASPCAAADTATQPSRNVPLAFDPKHDSMVASVGHVVAWKHYDVIPETAGFVVPSYIIRYYVQRIGKEPVLVYRGGGRRTGDDKATILEDGTILLWRRERIPESLLWLHDGKMKVQPMSKVAPDAGSVLALFPTGMITATGGDNADPAGTLWWVPIEKGDVDIDHKLKIGTGTSAKFAEWGRQIAWISPADVGAHGEPVGTALFNVFDTARRRSRSVKIQGSAGQTDWLYAFDGHFGISITHLFDAANGKVEEIPATAHLRGHRPGR